MIFEGNEPLSQIPKMPFKVSCQIGELTLFGQVERIVVDKDEDDLLVLVRWTDGESYPTPLKNLRYIPTLEEPSEECLEDYSGNFEEASDNLAVEDLIRIE